MKTLDAKTSDDGLQQVYFSAASAAAVSAFRKHGYLPVSVSALVKNKEEIVILPVKLDINQKDAVKFDEKLEESLYPVVEYVLANKGSKVVLFFASLSAETVLLEENQIVPRNAKILINSARTEQNMGKSETFEVPSSETLQFTNLEETEWQEKPKKDDLPAIISQQLLSKIWLTYVILRNMNTSHG